MIPVKLEMKNFGPYEDSTVSFDFSSALITGENTNIAGASNGTGKSTIFQAMAWVLTGYSRYKNSSSIIRDRTDSTKVIFDFCVGDTAYRIIRGRNRTNKQTLDFYVVNSDGSLEPVKADTNSKLDDKISEVTKIKYDSFLNTCYFAQNSISEFMYGTSTVRQKLIAEILDLDRWNNYAKRASAHLSEAEGELDILKFKMNTIRSGEQKRSQLQSAVIEAADLSTQHRALLRKLEDNVAALTAQLASQAGAESAQKARLQVQSDLLFKKEQLLKHQEKLASEEAKLKQIIIPAEPMSPGAAPAEPTEIANKLADRKGELRFLQNRISAMESGKCDNCGTKWEHDHDRELAKLKTEKEDLLGRIAFGEGIYTKEMEAARRWRSDFSAFQQAVSVRETEIARHATACLMIESAQQAVSGANQEIARLQQRLTEMPEMQIDLSVSEKLSEGQRQIKQTNAEILAAESRRASAQAELDVLANAASELLQMNERRQKLEELVGTYSALAKHFGKTGIQANILDTVVSEIETLANKFMSRLNYKPFTIRFVTQKSDTKGQIKETLDVEVVTPDSVKYIEDLSGGEQFRVAFSVRLALATVQARRQGGEINILLLDEVSSSLDKVGIETFVSIIRELEKTMKVMLITHDDSLKEHFDTTIHVANNGATAKIIQK